MTDATDIETIDVDDELPPPLPAASEVGAWFTPEAQASEYGEDADLAGYGWRVIGYVVDWLLAKAKVQDQPVAFDELMSQQG